MDDFQINQIQILNRVRVCVANSKHVCIMDEDTPESCLLKEER